MSPLGARYQLYSVIFGDVIPGARPAGSSEWFSPSYSAAVCVGENLRLGALAHYAYTEAKRFFGIPDFRYYALADGLRKLLEGSTRPFAGRKEPLLQEIQLSLFAP